MKIGFDAKRIFNNATGLGNYNRSLVENLARFYPQYHIHLYTPKISDKNLAPQLKKNHILHIPSVKPTWYWRTFQLSKKIKKEKIDIYHGLTNELPRGIHRIPTKKIVTIADLIQRINPHQYPWIDTQIYNWKLKYACENADIIIAISEHTKRDIMTYYGVSSQKIKVVYPSCDTVFLKKETPETIQKILLKYQLPNDYLFYVGSIIERKNLLTLVKSLEHLPFDIPLVVIGGGKSYKKTVLDYIQEKKLEHRVLFLKNVPNKDLPALYQQAQIFIYPSLYEGFGIPVIESLFSETPVITTKHSSLPEAGGPHAFYVEGTDTAELSHQIEKLLTDSNEKKCNIKKGLAYAKENFSAQATAKKLHEVYQSFP